MIVTNVKHLEGLIGVDLDNTSYKEYRIYALESISSRARKST